MSMMWHFCIGISGISAQLRLVLNLVDPWRWSWLVSWQHCCCGAGRCHWVSMKCVTSSRMKCAIWYVAGFFQYFKSLDSMVSRQFYTVFAPLYFRMFGWVLLGFQEPLDLTHLEFLLTWVFSDVIVQGSSIPQRNKIIAAPRSLREQLVHFTSIYRHGRQTCRPPPKKKTVFNHRPPGVQISSDQGVGVFCVDRSCGMFFHG